jgi:thiol-disulfide isomerase/thioredoxin
VTRRLLVTAAVLAAGCAAPAATAPVPSFSARTPTTAQLVAAARLSPCPPTGRLAAVADGLPRTRLPCLGHGPGVWLSGLRGRPTLLAVWAGWCLPCQREAPALQALARSTAGRLRVLGVLFVDDPRDGLDFAAHAGMRYPSVVDRSGEVTRLGLHVVAPPATVFVGAGGRVLARVYGPLDLSRLRALVARWLGVRW